MEKRKKQIPLNTDKGGLACTLTCAHHFAGNITHPRQGYRELGVLEIEERAIAPAQ